MTDMTHREMIPEKALEWHQAGKGAIIATVVETWGQRHVGSGAVGCQRIRREGRLGLWGLCGGGCYF